MLILLQGLVPTSTPTVTEAESTEEGGAPSPAPLEEDEEAKSEQDLCTKLSPEHLHRLYVFALVWGMGAFLELPGRVKFDLFLREKLATLLDLPSNAGDPQATVFDFYVNDEGKGQYLAP
jgi:hypothetical protein